MGCGVDRKLEVIEGENKPDPLSQLLRLGGFALGVTKKSIKFGVIMALETGEAIMYSSGQTRYAIDLEAREPEDRMNRELNTALFSLARRKPDDLKRGVFAALNVMSAAKMLRKTNPEITIENTSAIAEMVSILPDTDEGSVVAEAVAAECFAPIVDEFNNTVTPLHRPIPTQRNPSD